LGRRPGGEGWRERERERGHIILLAVMQLLVFFVW